MQAERKQVLLEFAEAQPKLALESNVFDHITSPGQGLKGGAILLISQLCKFRANERNVSLLTSCTASAAETRAVIN